MTRRFLTYFLMAGTLITGLVVAGVLLTVTGKPAKAGGGANVYHDFGCYISLDPVGGWLIEADSSHGVVTPSGNLQLRCQGTIPPERVPSKVIQIRGLGCFTGNGFTEDSTNFYTPGGHAILTCNVKRGH